MTRALVIIALVLASAVGLATPALAHTALISSDPADGARLDAAPSTVTLTFNEPLQDAGVNQIAVTGPDGGQWIEGQVEVRDNVATTRLRAPGPAGEYTIGFRVLSADGHPVADELTFTLTTPGTATSAPAAAASATLETRAVPAAEPDNGSAGVPIWVWIAGAGVLLAAGLALALRMGRNNP